jgi:hypothetical protein
MAFRRRVFEEIGDFREDLGHVGNGLAGGEDMEFYTRVLARYERIAYVPDAGLLHQVTEKMLQREYFLRRLGEAGRALAGYEPADSVPSLLGLPRYLVKQLAGETIAFLGRTLLLDGNGAFVHRCRLVHRGSYARGLLARRRDAGGLSRRVAAGM